MELSSPKFKKLLYFFQKQNLTFGKWIFLASSLKKQKNSYISPKKVLLMFWDA